MLAEAALVVPIAVGDMPVAVPRPPPSYIPLAVAEGAPTTVEQTVNPDPNVLGGAGLSPGVASSVAPSGTPVGPTEPAAEPMPNGEVSSHSGRQRRRASDSGDLREDWVAAQQCCQNCSDQFTSHRSLHH